MRSFLLPLAAFTFAFAGMIPARAADGPRIVAFGDSVTAPRGNTEVYPGILATDLSHDGGDVTVINAGVGGHTTAQAMARFERDVLQADPDLVVILFGINDAAVDVWKNPPAEGPRVPLADYRAHLSSWVKTLRDADIPVVLMTPNPLRWTDGLRKLYGKPPYRPDDPDGMNVLLHDYAAAVREIAREHETGLVDLHALATAYESKGPAKSRPFSRDGMHPESEGHRLIAAALIEELGRLDPRYRRKPGTLWKPSGEVNEVHPLATDITHDAPGPAVLGPALVKLDDGAVMSVFSTPTSYGGKPGECYIAGRTTRDGGKTWEPVRELTRLPQGRAAHPTVHRTRDGAIHLFFLGYIKFQWDKDHINPTPECRSDLWTSRSEDGGRTWSEPRMIYQGYTGSTNGAAETTDGRLVVPFSHYVSGPGRLVSRTVGSSDGGETWELSNLLDIGGAGDHDGALEPCIIELKDGRLWMLIRTTRGAFWESHSSDSGRTWTEARPGTIDSATAPAHLARLADGRLAMAWNRASGGRTRLHLALSDDEGKTWTPSLVAVRGSTTYPFLLEAKPGELWVGYMDAHAGWGTTPRARHFKIAGQAILDAAAKP